MNDTQAFQILELVLTKAPPLKVQLAIQHIKQRVEQLRELETRDTLPGHNAAREAYLSQTERT